MIFHHSNVKKKKTKANKKNKKEEIKQCVFATWIMVFQMRERTGLGA